jgi:hypothetical protein
VGIDPERLRAFTLELLETPPDAADDPAHHRRRTDAETLAYVLTLDAINFGSGWFPSLRKRPGCSGYFTVALAFADRFDAAGAWSAAELRGIDREELAEILGQDPSAPEVAALLELYARALRELGTFLEERYGGRFAGPLEAAAGSAARLVETLVEMPLYRDVARYGELEVPFLKRATISPSSPTTWCPTCSAWRACSSTRPGCSLASRPDGCWCRARPRRSRSAPARCTPWS